MSEPVNHVVGINRVDDTIAMTFARFEQAVLGQWSHAWRGEARKIFYAGFAACMRIVAESAEMGQDGWTARFQALHDEMGRHIATVLAEAETMADALDDLTVGPGKDAT